MSYVAGVAAAGANTPAVLQTGTLPNQASVASSDYPYFADILAAEMDSRMMRAAVSDGADGDLFSGISSPANAAMALLAGVLLEESTQKSAVRAPAEPAVVTEPAVMPEQPQTAPAEINLMEELNAARGLEVTGVRPGPTLAITSVYAGPSLAMYTDPVEAYGQFDTSAYINRTPEELQAARELAADYALERQGDPYSQSKRGQDNYVDCSYLTKWAYRQVGVNLPATAAEQARYCAQNNYEIPASELQKGDLIFWQKKGCGCGRYNEIHHVGVYIGDGKIVEASSSRGCVVVNSMWGDDGIGSWQIAMCARPM